MHKKSTIKFYLLMNINKVSSNDGNHKMIFYNNFPYFYSYIMPHLIPSFTFSTYLSLLNQVQSYLTLPYFLTKSFHSFIHSLTLTTLTKTTHTQSIYKIIFSNFSITKMLYCYWDYVVCVYSSCSI